MFVYAIIAVELVVLYAAFWYLFVRKPEHKSHITGNTWGAYNFASMNGPMSPEEAIDPWLEFQARNSDPLATYAHVQEFVWSHNANRYVPANQNKFGVSTIWRIADQLDRRLSQLNVKS